MNKERQAKFREIKNLIHNFCKQNLNPELEKCCFNLCDTIDLEDSMNILRSTSEQWAASIIYAIARLNFLFDRQNEYYISTDDLCNFFGTKKSTTGNKATQIERSCELFWDEAEYCSEEIINMFSYYKTPEGFIIPKSHVDNIVVKIINANPDGGTVTKSGQIAFNIPKGLKIPEYLHKFVQQQLEENLRTQKIVPAIPPPPLSIQEKMQKEKEEHLAELEEKNKKKKIDENQIGMFDIE